MCLQIWRYDERHDSRGVGLGSGREESNHPLHDARLEGAFAEQVVANIRLLESGVQTKTFTCAYCLEALSTSTSLPTTIFMCAGNER